MSADIYVRLSVNAAKSGLIAEMGADLWATLTVIASFMDGDGRCYPTQASVGRLLGVNRQTANKYVQRLLAFRRDGAPIIVAERARDNNGRFDRLHYRILPSTGYSIF
ncbi:helix-turn-helix domain-containing protein [Cohnella silvisoli]|uniref:Helix-turn-helix domain-containing protein n=1 Tax=Cohnella silvisoli TaxID=2873699 RepID=A0ABV1KYM4_9BACL|nr:helix-turn-helix domain-containing protein [Cohnella silvisoli]MCD9024386.1 helix-turn-helix domain-containing protein [Cohnella silvisoli]